MKPERIETRLRGLPLSDGYAVARTCRLNEHRHSNLPMYKVTGSGVTAELDRLERGLRIAGERLEQVRRDVEEKIGKAEAEIFAAQKMILADPELAGRIRSHIEREGVNAELAVRTVLDDYEARLLRLQSEYIRERATDIAEVKRHVLDVLGNMNPDFQCNLDLCQRGRQRIVVAEDLTPGMTVHIDSQHTLAFVTERGGVNSHAAILARALGIPAVSSLRGIRNLVGCGTELLVDGYTGEVVVWPTEETLREFRERQNRAAPAADVEEPVPGFRVMANINVVSDLHETQQAKAEGIGLYRTEFELLMGGRLFSEDELFEHYATALKTMGDRPVHFRMLDIGSDKQLPFLNLPKEENPSLGWRGARLLLGRKDLFVPQARALAKCSMGRTVHVLYPMIVDAEQFRRMKAAFQEATRDLPQGEIRHGIMFEVPSACLLADALYREIDFGSIGTNDLTQYLFAVDRDNEMVSYDYNSDRPVFWDLIGSIVRAARQAGKPLSICGELAGDPRFTARLMELGVDTVSVSPRRMAAVRRAARNVVSAEASAENH